MNDSSDKNAQAQEPSSDPVSRADVERRAGELALFEGRSTVTIEDLAQAEKELHAREIQQHPAA